MTREDRDGLLDIVEKMFQLIELRTSIVKLVVKNQAAAGYLYEQATDLQESITNDVSNLVG